MRPPQVSPGIPALPWLVWFFPCDGGSIESGVALSMGPVVFLLLLGKHLLASGYGLKDLFASLYIYICN